MDGTFSPGPGSFLSVHSLNDNDTVFVGAGGGVIVYEKFVSLPLVFFERRSTIHLAREASAAYYYPPYLFIGLKEGGLRIYDLSDLSSPVYVSALDLPGRVREILTYVTGTLFVAAGQGGLLEVDVSNPGEPGLRYQKFYDDAVYGMALQDDILLVAAGKAGLLLFRPASDPNLETPEVRNPGAGVLDVAVLPASSFSWLSDDYIYLLLDNQTVQIYIFTNLLNGTASPAGVLTLDRPYERLRVTGRYLVLNDGREHSAIYDLFPDGSTEPTEPSLRSIYPFRDFFCGEGTSCYGLGENFLRLLQTTDLVETETRVLYGALRDLAYANSTVFAVYGAGGFHIVDFSGSNPSELGNFTNATALSSMDAVALDESGTWAFVGGPEGLLVLNVSNSSLPVQKQYVSTNSPVKNLSFSGDRLYVLTSAGLQIYAWDTLTDPPILSFLGALPQEGVEHFLVNGTDLFLALGPLGIAIADASDPSNITFRSFIPTPGWHVSGLTLNGNLLYASAASSAGSRLYIVDVSSLSAPTVRGSLPLGMIYAGPGKVVGDKLYLSGDRLGTLSVAAPESPTWIEASGKEEVVKILEDSGTQLLVGFRNIGVFRINPAGTTCSEFTACFSGATCTASGFKWCDGLCRSAGCFPNSLQIGLVYNGTTPVDLLNGTASGYAMIFDCLAGADPVAASWRLGDVSIGSAYPSLKLIFGTSFQVFLGDSRTESWTQVYPFSTNLEGRLFCLYEENALAVKARGPWVSVEATPAPSAGGSGSSGGEGGTVVYPPQEGTAGENLRDSAEQILSEGVSEETVQSFTETLAETAETVSSDLEEEALEGEEAAEILASIAVTLEATEAVYQETGEIPVEQLAGVMELLDDVAAVAREQLSPEALGEVREQLGRAVNVAGRLVEELEAETLVQLGEGFGSLARSLLKVSVRPQGVSDSIEQGMGLLKRVVVRAVEQGEGRQALRWAVDTVSSFRGLVGDAMEKFREMFPEGFVRRESANLFRSTGEEDPVRAILDPQLATSFTEMAEALRPRTSEGAEEISPEDTKPVAEAIAGVLEAYFRHDKGLSAFVLEALGRVGEGLLEGIKDDLRLEEGIDLRPYLLRKASEAAGIDLTGFLRAEAGPARGIAPAIDPEKIVLFEENERDIKDALRYVLDQSGLFGNLTTPQGQILSYSLEDLRIALQVEKAVVLPLAPSGSIAAMPEGRGLLRRGRLGLQVSPAPLHPAIFAETLAELFDTDVFSVGPDGVFAFDNGEVRLRAAFGYLIGEEPAGFAQGLVTFSVVGGDPASEAYRVLVVYPDQTVQNLPPYPAADQALFDLLEDIFPGGWRFDRETGVLEITGVARFKTDYSVTSLTAEERVWFGENRDPQFGLAFQVEDVNGDGLIDVWVYSDEGKQLFWGL